MRATGSLVTAGVLSVALLVSPAAGATDLLGAIRAHADHAETPLVAWRPVSTQLVPVKLCVIILADA
jgi:hypothetical protein